MICFQDSHNIRYIHVHTHIHIQTCDSYMYTHTYTHLHEYSACPHKNTSKFHWPKTLANPSNCPSHCIYRSACHRSNSPFTKPPDQLRRRRHLTKVSTQYAHNHHSSCTPFTATTCPFKNSNNSMYNKLKQLKQAAFVIPLLLRPAPLPTPFFCPRTHAAF